MSLARGANRILVGEEIVQFAQAQPLGSGVWKLRGLLRGRGASEAAALAGHPAGTQATLLNDRLVEISATAQSQSSNGSFAALGFGDAEAVIAQTENAGASRRPPFPVHGRIEFCSDGSVTLSWVRRARGGWGWLDYVEQPLVEQAETYQVGLGPVSRPVVTWTTGQPFLALPGATIASLAGYSGENFWVRQIGSFSLSEPLLLGTLPPSV